MKNRIGNTHIRNEQVKEESPIRQLMKAVDNQVASGASTYSFAKAIYNYRAGLQRFNCDYDRLTPAEVKMITKWRENGEIPERLASLPDENVSLSESPDTENDNEMYLPETKGLTKATATRPTRRGRKPIYRTPYERLKAFRDRRKGNA
jgi:hypothetical protein